MRGRFIPSLTLECLGRSHLRPVGRVGQWAALGSDVFSIYLRYHLKKFLIQIPGNGEEEEYSFERKMLSVLGRF